jgi:hypothetical protein
LFGGERPGGIEMAIIVDHFQRREGADPGAFGIAAYEYCRAARSNLGMQSCRYYWVNLDLIVIHSEAESFEVWDRPPTPEAARASFALQDLARIVQTERWQEPRAAEEGYRLGGR